MAVPYALIFRRPETAPAPVVRLVTRTDVERLHDLYTLAFRNHLADRVRYEDGRIDVDEYFAGKHAMQDAYDAWKSAEGELAVSEVA